MFDRKTWGIQMVKQLNTQKFQAALKEAKQTPYVEALESSIADLLLSNIADELVWAPAKVVFDLPYKDSTAAGEEGPQVMAGTLVTAVDQAVKELFVVSPYFVSGDTGVERFRHLRQRGIRCAVVTNFLASTDVAAVYGGYKEYQKPLLELGVELWEIMAVDIKGSDHLVPTQRRSLHAKTFAIDGRQVFVGSFNWDPRSRGINTEMGVMVESDTLARGLVESVSAALPGGAWKLRLNEKGEVEWVDVKDGKEIVYTKPPQTSVWRRFSAWISGLDAIEGQL
jgi:putative cardiolipin synthase